MTETTTPTSWLPSLESLKSAKWSALAKYAALALFGWVAYAAYANADLVRDWLKPSPAPTVVEYVPAAKFQALQAEVASLRGAIQE